MNKSSRKDILDALTYDSSLDGCDGDWRRKVLDGADPEDIDFIKNQLQSKLPKEIETSERR